MSDEQEERYQLNEHGIAAVNEIIQFFEKGYSVEEIGSFMFPGEVEEKAVVNIRVMMAIASMTGVID